MRRLGSVVVSILVRRTERGALRIPALKRDHVRLAALFGQGGTVREEGIDLRAGRLHRHELLGRLFEVIGRRLGHRGQQNCFPRRLNLRAELRRRGRIPAPQALLDETAEVMPISMWRGT
jgi:hypothetical protein